jgi:hypothetical protein
MDFPVWMVVKDKLPSEVDVLMSKLDYQNLFLEDSLAISSLRILVKEQNSKHKLLFIDTILNTEIEGELSNLLREQIGINTEELNIRKDHLTFRRGTIVDINQSSSSSSGILSMAEIEKGIYAALERNGYRNYQMVSDLPSIIEKAQFKDTDKYPQNQILQVFFDDLDEADALVDAIENEKNFKGTLSASMEDLMIRKKVGVVGDIIQLIAVIINILGAMLLVLALFSIVNNHMDQNSENIGTLSAFGIRSRIIVLTYGLISAIWMLIIFFSSWSIAHFIAWINELSENKMVSSIISPDYNEVDFIRPDDSVFVLHLNNEILISYIAIPLIVIAILLFRKLTIFRISTRPLRYKTPVDLISDKRY